MAYYLITAEALENKLSEFKRRLEQNDFLYLQPFGRALTESLKNAKIKDNFIYWEEEDYCSPPLKEEKEQVLNKYFRILNILPVNKGEGWKEIKALKNLF